jgi:hypothetical protein
MLTGKTLDYGLNIKDYFGGIEREGRICSLRTEGMNPVCAELLELALQVDP